MDRDLYLLLIGAGIALVSSITTAIVQYVLTRRSFIQGRWWDRKADAYAEIIGSLATLTYSLERWREYGLQEYQAQEPLPQKAKEDLEAALREYQKTKTQIERTAIQGDYIISIKAAKVLSELINQLEKRPWGDEPYDWSGWIDYLSMRFAAAQDCLQVVRNEARSDLRLG